MTAMGFKRGTASGCLFWHEEQGLRCVVYGDDFTTTGTKRELDWFETELQRSYAITLRGRLGPGKKDVKEATLLNHVIRWVDGVGIEIEADPRQVERMVTQLGLEGANPVSCPGIKISKADLNNDTVIVNERATIFQAVTAQSNYIFNNRPECQFATN